MTGIMLHINDQEIQGFCDESYRLVTLYVQKSKQPPQQQQQQMQMPHPHPVMHQQQMAPVLFQPVLQPSAQQFQPVYQSSSSFQPVLQQIPPQPYHYVIQATLQPASTPTASATSTATSGNSQVGARGGQMWHMVRNTGEGFFWVAGAACGFT